MGPPGGGKSTLLKLLSGLLQKDSSLKVSCSASLQQRHAAHAARMDIRASAEWHRCIVFAQLRSKAAPQQCSMCWVSMVTRTACAVLPLLNMQPSELVASSMQPDCSCCGQLIAAVQQVPPAYIV